MSVPMEDVFEMVQFIVVLFIISLVISVLFIGVLPQFISILCQLYVGC